LAKGGVAEIFEAKREVGMKEVSYKEAAEVLKSAEALIIGTGAGMGVDSGLPDFRGDKGFWKAYPPYEKLGLSFVDMANPQWFSSDPEFAWGFYGHRLNLYRKTKPHDGFQILKKWGKKMKRGFFVFTSNVDGQFQRAGFEEESVVEVHGSIDWMQCTRDCGQALFLLDPGNNNPVEVDETTMRAIQPLPSCPSCGALVRPNILMFGDWGWDGARSSQQHRRLENWMDSLEGVKRVVVECGAGTAVPTVRHFCESVAGTQGVLIRINVRESFVMGNHFGLPVGALEGLSKIDTLL
jgi:NAD-dependent SIR2 family protein deacetylase